MATWRKLIDVVIDDLGETVVSNTLIDEEMDKEFSNGYGGSEGKSFTAWTENYVLFPIVYDGSEWVGYAPRNPNGVAMDHQGGE